MIYNKCIRLYMYVNSALLLLAKTRERFDKCRTTHGISMSQNKNKEQFTAKNNLVIQWPDPIFAKVRPSYGHTNQPKLTENDITTL